MRARLLAVALGVSFALGMAEVVLRLPGIHWSREVSNYVRGCYEDDVATPIWEFDPVLGLRLPVPHVQTRCEFNERPWSHRSDQLGHRNPEDWDRVDVALLGDSMVYGHGVEERDTAAHRLRDALGVRVGNLAQYGSSPVDYLAKVTSVVPSLHPRVAVVFLFRNDVGDLNRTRTHTELERFVATGSGRETRRLPLAHFREGATRAPRVGPLVRFASHSRAFRAARLAYRLHVQHLGTTERLLYITRRDDALGLAYTRRAMRVIHESLARDGTRLVIGFMPASTLPGSDAERMNGVVRENARAWAAELRVPYFDPSAAFVRPDGRPDYDAYLRRDWHLSREGNRRLARELAAFLVARGLVAAPR